MEVVLALGIIVLLMLFTFVKDTSNKYELRDTADKIATMIRESHQYYRATSDITTKVKVEYNSGGCTLTLSKSRKDIEIIKIPKNCALTWGKYTDADVEGPQNSVNINLMFRREGIYSSSDSGNGLTLYLTDKKSKKFIKITMVPTSGRLYIYDET